MRALAACVLTLLGTATAAHAQDAQPAKKKQVVARVKLFAGDPLGSREAGTVKCLVETRTSTIEGRPFKLVCGGELAYTDAAGIVRTIPFGRILTGTPRLTGKGSVEVDLRLENTTVQRLGENDVRQHTDAHQCGGTYRLGEPVKIRVGAGDKQVWAELVFEVRE